MWVWLLIAAAILSSATQAVHALAHFAVASLTTGLGLLAVAVTLAGQLGDAQIKNLTDRINALISGGLGGGAEVYMDPYSAGPGNAQTPISRAGLMRGPRGAGTEVCIEVHGDGAWRGNPLSFYVLAGGAVRAEAKYNGDAIPASVPDFGWSCRVTVTAQSPVQALCHVSAAISPLFPNAAGGTVGNAVPAEGAQVNVTIPVGADPVAVYAAFGGTGIGQRVSTHRTKISYYGG